MTDLWIPGFERVNLDTKWQNSPDGGPYDEFHHPKFGWHSWEGHNIDSAENSFRPYPPHCAVSWELGLRRQYIPLNRHAYAFAGSDNDDSFVVQVEVAGYAGESHNWPKSKNQWLGEEVVFPIEQIIGIPHVIPPQGFKGQGDGFLATAKSKLRFTVPQMDAFSGHLGHQHMPSPDQHWDPGRLNIQSILWFAEQVNKPEPQPEEEEDMPVLYRDPDDRKVWCVDAGAHTKWHVKNMSIVGGMVLSGAAKVYGDDIAHIKESTREYLDEFRTIS